MQRLIATLLVAFSASPAAWSQGEFGLSNITAPTRLGSAAGPLAGRGIWAQGLGGFTPDSLTPVGVPTEHDGDGVIFPAFIQVPWAPAGAHIFVRMAAWDGTVWGTNFANVPANQLGYTDTVQVRLTPTNIPVGPLYPMFTQPAVVPLVPEPSIPGLAAVGSLMLLYHRRRRLRPHALLG